MNLNSNIKTKTTVNVHGKRKKTCRNLLNFFYSCNFAFNFSFFFINSNIVFSFSKHTSSSSARVLPLSWKSGAFPSNLDSSSLNHSKKLQWELDCINQTKPLRHQTKSSSPNKYQICHLQPSFYISKIISPCSSQSLPLGAVIFPHTHTVWITYPTTTKRSAKFSNHYSFVYTESLCSHFSSPYNDVQS